VLYRLEVSYQSSLAALPKLAASMHPPLVLAVAVLVGVDAELVLAEEHTCHVPGQVSFPLVSPAVRSSVGAEEEILLDSCLQAVVDSLVVV
jgi:hypothetical protein